MIARMMRHEIVSFARAPLAVVFTVAIPLVMMVIIGLVVGDAAAEPGTNVRVMQFVVPVMAVYGVAQACLGTLAIRLTELRERGTLRRLRGTPAPAWSVLAGLIGAALTIALLTTALLVAIGVIFYGLQPVWRTMPALLVTLLVGVACFTALGFAVATLAPNAAVAQLIGTGLLLLLAFISDVIPLGARMPGWLEGLAWTFPLRHLARPVRDAFNPFLAGSGFQVDHLVVMAVWGMAGAALAMWRFRWDRPESRTETARPARPTGRRPARPTGRRLARPAGRPAAWRVVAEQAGHALAKLRRDLATVFFTAALPVLLLALLSLIFAGVEIRGVPLPAFMVAAMTTYAVGVACYVNLAEALSGDRERGVLKRLAGTPLPRWAYYSGQLTCALTTTLFTAVLIVVVAAAGYGVRFPAATVPAMLVTIALAAACFVVLGALVAALVRRQQSVNAVTLGTLLPLAFISDVFIVGGELPGVLQTLGDVFPLKHVSHALLASLDGGSWAWADLAVVAAWLVAGTLALALAGRRPLATAG